MLNADHLPPGPPAIGQPVVGLVEVLDAALPELIDPRATLTRLADGCAWTEGPVYLRADDSVLFSDIPNNRLLRWTEASGVRVEQQPAGFQNGHTLDREGRVVTCEHGTRCVSRMLPDGTSRTLVEHYQGNRLNSPNDVVVKSDGTIWFTDPPYGILSNREGYAAPSELDGCYVFRLDPETGDLVVMTGALVHPNGLAFSPDERVLYVADSSSAALPDGHHRISAFEVIDGIRLGPPSPFFETEHGWPDGIRVDIKGNVWTSAGDGIHIVAPDGRRLGQIRVPEAVSNCVFGGRDGRSLFITASSSLYVIAVRTLGAGVAAEVSRRAG